MQLLCMRYNGQGAAVKAKISSNKCVRIIHKLPSKLWGTLKPA